MESIFNALPNANYTIRTPIRKKYGEENWLHDVMCNTQSSFDGATELHTG